jgi:hypothetical protein
MSEIELVYSGRSSDGAEVFSVGPTHPQHPSKRIAKPEGGEDNNTPLSWLGAVGSLTLAICLGLGA